MAGLTGWFGGKNQHSPWIYSFIPKDIKTYCEPFSGSFPIYFNEDFSHVENIIYNDANKLQVNLMACAKDYDNLLDNIEKSFNLGGFLYTNKIEISDTKKHYRDLYTYVKDGTKCDFYDNLNFEIPNFEKAVIYSFMITSAFNACHARGAGFSGFSSGKYPKLKIHTLINKLKNKNYQHKLDNLNEILNCDFEEVINRFDSKDTFFYLDPPYKLTDGTATHNTDYGSHDTFGENGHERLKNILLKTKSRWALSYYWFKELEEWFPRDKFNWYEKEFHRSSASFSNSNKGIELLITNY